MAKNEYELDSFTATFKRKAENVGGWIVLIVIVFVVLKACTG